MRKLKERLKEEMMMMREREREREKYRHNIYLFLSHLLPDAEVGRRESKEDRKKEKTIKQGRGDKGRDEKNK